MNHPERTCQRCGGPNTRTWHAPSPLWNAVMRDPATRADRWQIVCPACFVDLAHERGIEGSWHFAPHGLDLESIWDDADGRVWNAERCRWSEYEVEA